MAHCISYLFKSFKIKIVYNYIWRTIIKKALIKADVDKSKFSQIKKDIKDDIDEFIESDRYKKIFND